MTTHTMIIKSVEKVAEGDELTVDFHYKIEIECPGVTDACAEWEECGVSGCPAFRGVETDDWELRGHEVHGVEHRYLREPGFWGVRTGGCFAAIHGHAIAGEIAERHRLEVGRYVIEPEFDDGDLTNLELLAEADCG